MVIGRAVYEGRSLFSDVLVLSRQQVSCHMLFSDHYVNPGHLSFNLGQLFTVLSCMVLSGLFNFPHLPRNIAGFCTPLLVSAWFPVQQCRRCLGACEKFVILNLHLEGPPQTFRIIICIFTSFPDDSYVH